MRKKRWKKILLLLMSVCILGAAGKFLYDDYYTLKEADLILFMGQSNMSGAGGNAAEAPKLRKGAGYEYRAITEPDGLCVLSEPFGEKEHREGYLDDRELIPRNGSLATAFVNAYYRETKERVVAVSASRGSAQISSFNEKLAEDAIGRLENAKYVMNEQHVRIRDIYMLWFQGETDAYVGTEEKAYISGMQELFLTMKKHGVQKCFVIQIGNVQMGGETVDTAPMRKIQEKLCETDENFVLVSTLPAKLTGKTYTEDGIHFNQTGLNLIGGDAGKHMGAYVRGKAEGR